VVTRTRAIAVAAGLLVGAAGFALTSTAHHRAGAPRVAARTPAAVISVSPPPPPPTPLPTPTVDHSGLRIKVTEVGIDLPIVEGDGYNAPLYKAVQYPGTSWPGEGGRSVIYAHARTGMFGPLFGAAVGMHIEITGPGGVVQRYVVTQYFPRWPVTDLRWLRPGDHEEIVLTTCTTYNYNDPRIVVVGEPA
jgi:LPXTG-site transpeptidase (sortase) family protein